MEATQALVALDLPQVAAFVALFLPGFVSLKVDQLIHPGQRIGAADAAIEILGYSLLNAAFFGWLIILIGQELTRTDPNLWLLALAAIPVCALGPAFWPLAFRKLQKVGASRGWLLGQHRYAWDNVFARRRYGFVIVHLIDGQHIGGYFGENSYASVEPESGHLYLEELWAIDHEGRFLDRLPDSLGAVFRPADYKWVEFFEDDVDET